MPLQAVGHALNQHGTVARAGVFQRGAGGVVNLQHIVAVDAVAGDAVAFGAVSDRLGGHLQLHRRRVGVLVVLHDHDQRQFMHGGEVQPFVERSCGGCAFACVGDQHAVAPAVQPLRPQHPTRHRNRGPQHAGGMHDAQTHVAHVAPRVFAARGGVRLAPDLAHHLFGRHPAEHEHGHITVDGRDEVVGAQRVGRADLDGFLPARAVHIPAPQATFFLCVVQRLVKDAGEPQPAINLQ
jgi:hypothetical protein